MSHFGFIKNGVFIAVIAHGLIGISLVWDKVLLKTPGTKNLLSYVFWLGAISVFGVVLVPFGYKTAPASLIALAFGTGMIDLAGVFFYYMALKRGEASETLAIMGGFSPVATVAIGFALLSKQMSGWSLVGFALMTAGGFVMFFSERFALKKLLGPMLLASGLLGLENVLLKVVYNRTNFVTGYVWFTIGTFAGAMALLVPPSWRRQIFAESGQDNPRSRLWYFVNRFVAGVGAFLVTYAISLAHPALVDAISGVRYAVIFLGAYLLTVARPSWLKEDFHGWQLVTKALATLLVVAGLVLAGLAGGKAGGGTPTATERTPSNKVDPELQETSRGAHAPSPHFGERSATSTRFRRPKDAPRVCTCRRRFFRTSETTLRAIRGTAEHRSRPT
jgi:drug/metabolite transporter (DMT)-like permease